MGQFSVEKPVLPGSALSGNQQSEMIEVLKHGSVIGRGTTREAIDRLTRKLSESLGASIVFARFSPNSGSVTGITLEQERKGDYERAGHAFVRSLSELEELLGRGDVGCVVFVDDQFATGGQAHAQLLHWAGTPRESWPPETRSERNIDLSRPGDKTLDFLKTGKVRLAFIFGTEAGKNCINGAAQQVGFVNMQALYDQEIPSTPVGLSVDLRDFLKGVGYQLLRGSRHGEDQALEETEETALHKDALGYGNFGTVMVTASSAPSHAITALWCPGIYDRQPWIPLFLRRGYRKSLVLG